MVRHPAVNRSLRRFDSFRWSHISARAGASLDDAHRERLPSKLDWSSTRLVNGRIRFDSGRGLYSRSPKMPYTQKEMPVRLRLAPQTGTMT